MSDKVTKAQVENILRQLSSGNDSNSTSGNNNTRILNHGYEGNNAVLRSDVQRNVTRLLSEGKDFYGNALNE